jgi:hypothetical protein
MKQEQTITWSAIITFIEPNSQEIHQAYATGDTLSLLKEDATRVYNALKTAGRTPLKVVVVQKLQKTFEIDEDDEDFWDSVSNDCISITVICGKCGQVFHNPDEELKQGIYCPDCGTKVK